MNASWKKDGTGCPECKGYGFVFDWLNCEIALGSERRCIACRWHDHGRDPECEASQVCPVCKNKKTLGERK